MQRLRATNQVTLVRQKVSCVGTYNQLARCGWKMLNFQLRQAQEINDHFGWRNYSHLNWRVAEKCNVATKTEFRWSFSAPFIQSGYSKGMLFMSKRKNMLFALALAGLAFSMSASARDVGTIGVVIRPVIANPDDQAADGDEAVEICTPDGLICWSF